MLLDNVGPYPSVSKINKGFYLVFFTYVRELSNFLDVHEACKLRGFRGPTPRISLYKLCVCIGLVIRLMVVNEVFYSVVLFMFC